MAKRIFQMCLLTFWFIIFLELLEHLQLQQRHVSDRYSEKIFLCGQIAVLQHGTNGRIG